MRYIVETKVTATNPAERRRSERVMLQVPVVVQARTRDGKEVREETQTVVVNAHGGLLKLLMEVKVGQPFLLINERSTQEQRSHVVRVEPSPPPHSPTPFHSHHPPPPLPP